MGDSAALMTGKRGLVMGVANDRSIAWGVASALGHHGAELAFTYQDETFLKRVRPLAASLGSNVVLPCDVSDQDSIDAVFAALEERWGGLDFVVHAIAYSDREELKGKYLDTTRDNFTRTMDISCYSFTAVAKAAAPLMNRGGSLVTLTYLGSQRVMPHYNVMGVAKAALEASVRYLAADLGRDGVRVNALSAGPMRTLAGSAISSARYIYKWSQDNAPLRRSLELEEVGAAALYLLSDLASAVTGEVHYVDGGYHIVGMKAVDARPAAPPAEEPARAEKPPPAVATPEAAREEEPGAPVAAYDDAIDQARKMYDETVEHARTAYDEVVRRARNAYDEVVKHAHYDGAAGQARSAYDELVTHVRSAYDDAVRHARSTGESVIDRIRAIVGAPEVAPSFQVANRKSSYAFEELLQCAHGELFGPRNARLPLPPMLMFDRIVRVSDEGGKYGKGEIVAELDIKPDLWFFDCHFEADPVMPGCLGLDALWQLVGFYLGWLGCPGRGRALGVGEVKLTGQVLPSGKLMRYHVDLKRVIQRRLVLGIADAAIELDGDPIYEARDLRVGLFAAADTDQGERP